MICSRKNIRVKNLIQTMIITHKMPVHTRVSACLLMEIVQRAVVVKLLSQMALKSEERGWRDAKLQIDKRFQIQAKTLKNSLNP
jgi:hypothetical protein